MNLYLTTKYTCQRVLLNSLAIKFGNLGKLRQIRMQESNNGCHAGIMQNANVYVGKMPISS